jgi:hypothetical protein
MVRDGEGKVWASVLAVLAVTLTVGVLYLPLFVE